MSNPRIRKSGRTPTNNKLLLDDDTLSTSSEDYDSSNYSSEEEWEPSHFEEPLVVPQGTGDDEFDGPVEDPLAIDFDDLQDSEDHDVTNSPVIKNYNVIKEEDLAPSTGRSSTKRNPRIGNANQKRTRGRTKKKQQLTGVNVIETSTRLTCSEEETQAVIVKHEVDKEECGKQKSAKKQREPKNKQNKPQRQQQTYAQKQRRLELQRLRRKQMTEEQRKIENEKRRIQREKEEREPDADEKLERRRENARIRRQQMTDEQRQQATERQRIWRHTGASKMKEDHSKLQKELEREDLTDKEREEKMAKLKEIEETMFHRTMKQYLNRHGYLSTLTPEERKNRRRREHVARRLKHINETPEERQERLNKSREKYRKMRLRWTPEQHEHHREWMRNKTKAQPYSQWSAEKKERILAYQREKLKRETPEQREYRLARYKRNIEKKKLLNKMQEDGVSKEDAENALRISRPDLYPGSNRGQKGEPKPYVPRDPNKQLPPPGRKSNVTPEELAEFQKELEQSGKRLRRRRRRCVPEKTTSISEGENNGSITSESNNIFPKICEPNSTATSTSTPELHVLPHNSSTHPPGSSDLHSISEKPISVLNVEETSNTSTILIEVIVNVKPDEPSNYVPIPRVVQPSETSVVQSSVNESNECPAEVDFEQSEILSEKKPRVDEIAIDNIKISESDEERTFSPVGSPIGEANDSDTDTDNNKYDNEDVDYIPDAKIDNDTHAVKDDDLQNLNTSGNEKSNDAQQASSESQENTSNNKVEKHTCDKCGKVYSSQKLFNLHMEAHENENCKTFRCPRPSCGKEFKHSAYVLDHYRKMHGGKPATNKKATKPASIKTTNKCGRKEARNVTANSNSSICPYCGKTFDTRHLLARHISCIHEYNPEDGGFMCQHCSKIFKSKCYLGDHIRRVHLGMDHKCDICGRSFQSRTKLWKHKMEAHDMKDLDPSSIDSNIRILQCEYCGVKMFRGLKAHVQKHHPERLEEFLNPSSGTSKSPSGYMDLLARKRQYWHKVGKFKKQRKKTIRKITPITRITHCSPSSSKQRALAECTICNKFLHPDSLRKHMERMHPHPSDIASCDKCQRVCSSESALVVHIINRHPKLAKFKVQGVFVDASGEQGEEETGEKHRVCQFCRARQDDRYLYMIHLYDEHSKDIIQNFKEGLAEEQANPSVSIPCPYCDVIIRSNNSGLVIHVRKKHHGKNWDEFRSNLKKNRPARQPQKKQKRKMTKVAKNCSSSDDEIDEDANDQEDYCERTTRKSTRERRLPRRYFNEENSDSGFLKLKKVKVPSSPAKFTLEEQKLFEKHQDINIKWKGNPVVVLEPFDNAKT